MAKLGELTLLDIDREAILRDPETNTDIVGHVIADPLYVGKLAFRAKDNGDIINIFLTDEIHFL